MRWSLSICKTISCRAGPCQCRAAMRSFRSRTNYKIGLSWWLPRRIGIRLITAASPRIIREQNRAIGSCSMASSKSFGPCIAFKTHTALHLPHRLTRNGSRLFSKKEPIRGSTSGGHPRAKSLVVLNLWQDIACGGTSASFAVDAGETPTSPQAGSLRHF